MKITGALVGSAVYCLGLLVVQAHLLRHGIYDLSALEFYYLLVGVWMILTLSLPAKVASSNVKIVFRVALGAEPKRIFSGA